jgi:flagellar basal-body rod protein FlgB
LGYSSNLKKHYEIDVINSCLKFLVTFFGTKIAYVIYIKGVLMSIEISATHALLGKAMDYRAMRQDMISSNIANADTPFYRPRDVRFEEALAHEKNKILNKNEHKLEMVRTDETHMRAQDEKVSSTPTLYFRDGHMARNDGNSVDLDVETTEMSKNSIMFNAIINTSKKSAGIFKSVIEASQKIS